MAPSRCGRRANWPTRSTASARAVSTSSRNTRPSACASAPRPQDRAANTFGACAREFFAEYRTKHKQRPRGWRADALALGLRYPLGSDPATTEPEVIKGGLAAIWDTKPVAEIDANDVHVVVTDARKRGIPGLGRRNDGTSETRGRRMHAALSVLFRWLVRQRKIASNPCTGVDRPSAPPDRERVLTDAEIVAFWHACDQIGSPFGPLFKILLLTGARLREAANMTRGELGADGVWTIPGSRTKNHRPLSLPLPPLTRQIIAARAGDRGRGRLRVHHQRSHAGVAASAKAKRQLDAAMAKVAGHAVPAFRLHDLRRTAASGMAALGVALPVIEKTLNHVCWQLRWDRLRLSKTRVRHRKGRGATAVGNACAWSGCANRQGCADTATRQAVMARRNKPYSGPLAQKIILPDRGKRARWLGIPRIVSPSEEVADARMIAQEWGGKTPSVVCTLCHRPKFARCVGGFGPRFGRPSRAGVFGAAGAGPPPCCFHPHAL